MPLRSTTGLQRLVACLFGEQARGTPMHKYRVLEKGAYTGLAGFSDAREEPHGKQQFGPRDRLGAA
jgi:hypothetical protein